MGRGFEDLPTLAPLDLPVPRVDLQWLMSSPKSPLLGNTGTAWDSGRLTSLPNAQGPASVDSPSDLLAQVRRHIQNNRYSDAEALIISNPSLVKQTDEFGNTLLTIASQNNRKRFVKLFLRHGADINAQNGQGNAPLHYCSAYNFTEVADYLMSKGANSELRNHSQALPSHMSVASLSSKMFSSSDPIPSGIQPH